jgi:periplasmic copper chaperone A
MIACWAVPMENVAMNRRFAGIRARALACGLGLFVLAADASALFIVNQPWLRPAKSGQSTEMYMNLTSTDGAALVGVHTDEAAGIVIRGPGKDARTLDTLPLPAKTLVALAPGKTRLVVIKLARTVRLGERVAITLTIQGADGVRQEIPLQAEARMRSPVDDELRSHGQHSH